MIIDTLSSSGRRTKRHETATAVSSSNRQRAESEPVMKLFGEDWLQVPNCVGSFVAAMGEEPEGTSRIGVAGAHRSQNVQKHISHEA
jgi:hypothetical protein